MPLGFYGLALRKLKEQGKLTEKWNKIYEEVFSPAPKEDIPENYTRLSYLEKSSGAGYVELDYYPTHNTKVETEMMITGFSTESSTRFLYGSYSQASGFDAFACGCYSANASIPGNLGFWFQAPKDNTLVTGYAPDHAHKYHVIQSKEGVYLDGEFLGEFTKASEEFTSTDKFWLYRTAGWSNAWCYGRFYSFKIWESEELLYDLVPVYNNTSSKYGFYNKVDKKFYPTSTNSGFSGE